MGAGQGIAAAVVAAGLAGSAGGQGGGDEPTPPRYKEKATTVSTAVESGRYGLDSWALEVTDGYALPTPTTVQVSEGLARFAEESARPAPKSSGAQVSKRPACQEDQPCWDWRTMGNRQRGVCASGVWMIQNPDGSLQRTNAAGVDVTGWECREGMARVGNSGGTLTAEDGSQVPASFYDRVSREWYEAQSASVKARYAPSGTGGYVKVR